MVGRFMCSRNPALCCNARTTLETGARSFARWAELMTHQVGWVCPLTRFGFGNSEPRPKNRKMTGAPSSLPSSLRATFTDSSGSLVHSRSGSPLHSRNSHESCLGTGNACGHTARFRLARGCWLWRRDCSWASLMPTQPCAGQRGAGDDTDRESFHGTPPSVAAPSMAKS
jgi:hypothetical protein